MFRKKISSRIQITKIEKTSLLGRLRNRVSNFVKKYPIITGIIAAVISTTGIAVVGITNIFSKKKLADPVEGVTSEPILHNNKFIIERLSVSPALDRKKDKPIFYSYQEYISEEINSLTNLICEKLTANLREYREYYENRSDKDKNIIAKIEAAIAYRPYIHQEYDNNEKSNMIEKLLKSLPIFPDVNVIKDDVNKKLAILNAPQHVNTYKTSIFPERAGGKIKFYSDGYNDANKNSGAFNDILNSIYYAKETVILTGWTLSHTQKFKFCDNLGENKEMTLPELFALKALQGVDVVLLPWKNIAGDFKTATDNFLPAVEKEIKKLAESESKNRSNRRYWYKKPDGIAKELRSKIHAKFSDTALFYSDHAKMVITDSKELYMGGLDLTEGRPDIQTWHDCHCRIEGPNVQDAVKLLSNRYKAQAENKDPKKERQAESVLKRAEEKARNLAGTYEPRINEETGEVITQQLFTAIRKPNYDPNNKEGIKWENDTHVKEIMTSQMTAIEAANDFIYMENQYFMGPRIQKNGDEKLGHNLVIVALCNKIKEQIKAGKPFHFYCQLPFRPEGEHDNFLVELMLRKQWKTMQWFINSIKNEINTYNEKNPTTLEKEKRVGDYITFSNLGFQNPNKTTENGYEMKYTHSKLMIVDDKTAFIGSNNCNERSTKGNRDHEVCMCVKNDPEIKSFRQSLMKQHFGEECMEGLEKTDPGAKAFSARIKGRLNASLTELNIARNQKLIKTKPSATPWGNIPTSILEMAEKPPHVPDRANKLLSLLRRVNKRIRRFHK